MECVEGTATFHGNGPLDGAQEAVAVVQYVHATSNPAERATAF